MLNSKKDEHTHNKAEGIEKFTETLEIGSMRKKAHTHIHICSYIEKAFSATAAEAAATATVARKSITVEKKTMTLVDMQFI